MVDSYVFANQESGDDSHDSRNMYKLLLKNK